MKKSKEKKKKVVRKSQSATKALWVWRIFHFGERFELSENIRKCRKSALEFSRDFIGDAGGDEAVGYQRQFSLLQDGDGLEFGLLYGLYRLLVNMAAKQSRAFRGYLLDARNRPLSDAQIGKLLHVETRRMSKILRQFASVDLLERVELPEFDLSMNDPPPRNDDERDSGSGKKKSAAGTRKSRSGGGGRGRAEISGRGRSGAEISARVRKPLKESGKKVKSKHGNYLSDNGKSQREINNDKRCNVSCNALEGQGKGRTTTAPATAQSLPSKPRGSATGGILEFPSPRGAVFNNRSGPQRIGEIVQGVRHRYDSDCEDFGGEVYEVLGLTFSPLTVRGRRELGCFASVWERARTAGLKPEVLAELRRRAIVEATKLARRKQRCRNVSAVFCHVFNRLLAKAAAAGGVAARTDRAG